MRQKMRAVIALFAVLSAIFLSGFTHLPSEATAQGMHADIYPYTKGNASNFALYPHSTVNEPTKGGSFYDSNYGTTVIKAADAKEFTLSENSGNVIRPVYSRWRIDNSAGDLYYLVKAGETPPESGNGQMILYYSANDSIYKVATEVNGLETSEFRWDYSGSKPYVMYYVDGTQFREYNVETGETQLVRDFSADFPGAERILNDVEGDSSADSRYWAWMVQGIYTNSDYPLLAIITYDKQSNTVLGKLDYAKYQSMGGAESSLPKPNMVDITPLGTKVVPLWGRTDRQDAFDGPHAYDLDFSHPVKVSNDETHGGWAFDYNGDEVYVSQINNDNWATADADTIAYVNIRTGEVNVILYSEDMGWDVGGMHFGRFYNRAITGWVYMTTHSESSSTSWMANNAVMLEIKPYTQHPRVWRIADTHNKYPSPEDPLAYEREAFSPISGDGMTIYWGADWPGGDGTVDTYKVKLPANWWVNLRSGDTPYIPEFPAALIVLLVLAGTSAFLVIGRRKLARHRSHVA